MRDWVMTTDEFAKRKVVMVGITNRKSDLDNDGGEVQQIVVEIEAPGQSRFPALLLEFPMTVEKLAESFYRLADLMLQPPE